MSRIALPEPPYTDQATLFPDDSARRCSSETNP
jgi:hypothetical protein